jgi:hypothetical protein
VSAVVKDLTSLIQSAVFFSVHYKIFFLQAKSIFFGYRVVSWCPFQKLPFDIIIDSFVLQIPNMRAELGLYSASGDAF